LLTCFLTGRVVHEGHDQRRIAGLLPPVAGAGAQELIDILAILNALRTAIPPSLTDF
jgi:hypothetical protein